MSIRILISLGVTCKLSKYSSFKELQLPILVFLTTRWQTEGLPNILWDPVWKEAVRKQQTMEGERKTI